MQNEKKIILQQTPYTKCATVYSDPDIPQRACLLYFHGGGLLYGNRKDLPQLHLDMLTGAGFTIIALDYPLAPAAKLGYILEDVVESINLYCEHPEHFGVPALPYFLWGRSSGAYLCLMAAAGNRLAKTPTGVLSYYGYGFLTGNWYEVPSPYYCTLPPVSESCLNVVPKEIHSRGTLDTHYSVYVYARQTGKWKNLIYEGRDKYFLLDFSLHNCDTFPCPLFCAHSMQDTDVPFAEFQALCQKYHAQRFLASAKLHDFDREETGRFTKRLLEATVQFVEKYL